MQLIHEVEQRLGAATIEDVVRHDHSWGFYFSSGALMVEQLWRLLESGVFVVTDREDGLTFGEPVAVDAEGIARRLLVGRRVLGALIDPETADLTIFFEGEVRLDVRTTSRRYEAWHFDADGFLAAAAGGRLAEPSLMFGNAPET